MTELSFAKSFLSTLDARAQKLPADHVSDLKTLDLSHSYLLPRMPHPMRQPFSTSTQTHPLTCTVTLKSTRNPTLSLTLPALDTGTTVLELKERVAREIRLQGVEKVRVLWAKKPCSDAKTVKEVVGEGLEEGKEVEFGVMVMGYVASNLKGGGGEEEEEEGGGSSAAAAGKEGKGSVVAQGESGVGVLSGETFWDDLRGFLVQRVRDEGVAGEAFEVFRGAWRRR